MKDPNPIYGVRLETGNKDSYVEACKKLGVNHPDMIRDMIDAFTEGRLRIAVPKSQLKIIKGLHYVERT